MSRLKACIGANLPWMLSATYWIAASELDKEHENAHNAVGLLLSFATIGYCFFSVMSGSGLEDKNDRPTERTALVSEAAKSINPPPAYTPAAASAPIDIVVQKTDAEKEKELIMVV